MKLLIWNTATSIQDKANIRFIIYSFQNLFLFEIQFGVAKLKEIGSNVSFDISKIIFVKLKNSPISMATTIKNQQYNGWFQSLFREKVKSQRIGNRTLNSESASKIMPACEIWVFQCMCKCLFFQKTFLFVLMGKLPQKWTNLKTFWI